MRLSYTNMRVQIVHKYFTARAVDFNVGEISRFCYIRIESQLYVYVSLFRH